MKILKHYHEFHQKGPLSIEQDMQKGIYHCDLGIAFDSEGKLWLCMNHQAILRFKPFEPYKRRKMSDASDGEINDRKINH